MWDCEIQPLGPRFPASLGLVQQSLVLDHQSCPLDGISLSYTHNNE